MLDYGEGIFFVLLAAGSIRSTVSSRVSKHARNAATRTGPLPPRSLKSWFRLGIFTEEDLHAIVGTRLDAKLVTDL